MIYLVGIQWHDIGKMTRHKLDIIDKKLNRLSLISGHNFCAALDLNEIIVLDASYNEVLIRSPVSPLMESALSEIDKLCEYWYWENNTESIRNPIHQEKYLSLKHYFNYVRKNRKDSSIGSSVRHNFGGNVVGY